MSVIAFRDNPMVGEIVDSLSEWMGGYSIIALSSVTNIHQDILNDYDKLVKDLDSKDQFKLESFYIVIFELHSKGLDGLGIWKVISKIVFPDGNGCMDSVVSAIDQQKYELETLTHIASMAYREIFGEQKD